MAYAKQSQIDETDGIRIWSIINVFEERKDG